MVLQAISNLGQVDHNLPSHIFDEVTYKLPIEIGTVLYFQISYVHLNFSGGWGGHASLDNL